MGSKTNHQGAQHMNAGWNARGYWRIQEIYQHRNGIDLLDRMSRVTNLSGQRVLDLGSGDGNLTQEIAKRVGVNGNVVGVDYDASMIARSERKNRFSNIRFICDNIVDWTTKGEGQFDSVFSNATLHWLDGYRRFDSLIYRVRDLLYLRGCLAIRFSLERNGADGKRFLEHAVREFLNDDQIVLKKSNFEFETCRHILTKRGFEIAVEKEVHFKMFETDYHKFLWMVYSQPLGQFIPSEMYNEFLRFLEQKWRKSTIDLFGHHAIFVARVFQG